MNPILTLRGNRFEQRSRKGKPGAITILKTSKVELSRLEEIYASFLQSIDFWENNQIVEGVLISVYYDRIVAKSNRLQGYLKGEKKKTPNDSIVGAKFNKDKNKHIITHYVSKKQINQTLENARNTIEMFKEYFPSGEITHEEFSDATLFKNLPYKDYQLSKTTFQQILRDSCFVERFGIEEAEKEELKNSIVTFYDVDMDVRLLLEKIGVTIEKANVLDKTTALLDEKMVDLVLSRVPYLVSMAIEDFSKMSPEDFYPQSHAINTDIPLPTNEPTIGVIDTLFEKSVYFSDWVESFDLISPEIRRETSDYRHGTAVSSLIVEGHKLNERLDDGCGRFKVRHFGVALHSGFNSFSIIKRIKEIVSQNTDIKVWNLSLGSNDEIRDNFISAEAAMLDQIQFEYDVLFVIAGTNALRTTKEIKKIGAPADSLNSVVVNAVDFDGKSANYSRQGVVLSFFLKPDVSYYGGGNGQYVNVCEPFGLAKVSGTSYAAPFIARKLAYLIHIIGLSREEAKALLIDSAIGWNNTMGFEEKIVMGNGIVPIKLDDLLSTSEDEIKFIISDTSEKYDSFNYNFPVPVTKKGYPFVAKATMCYFPKCSRNQGVDYTNTELNVTFGRLTETGIRPINNDRQNEDEFPAYIKENSARHLFRKWDNVKHVGEKFTPRKQVKSILNAVNPQWGMSVKTIERLKKRDGQGIRFGVVVTLKELNGVNRLEEFINQAQLRGWSIKRIEVESQLDLYNKLTEEIEFE